MGRASFGPAITVNLNSSRTTPPAGRQRRVTNDASPKTLAEALPGMKEVGRFPNVGGYSLLYDAATDEFVLFNLAVQSPQTAPPPGWKRDPESETGIYANPTGLENAKWSPAGMAKKTEVIGADSYGSKSPAARPYGTADSSFHNRALRLIGAERTRGQNDANRARYGQAPIPGRPGHGEI